MVQRMGGSCYLGAVGTPCPVTCKVTAKLRPKLGIPVKVTILLHFEDAAKSRKVSKYNDMQAPSTDSDLASVQFQDSVDECARRPQFRRDRVLSSDERGSGLFGR